MKHIRTQEYHRLVNQSYNLLKKNLVIMIPNVFMLFITLLISLIFLNVTGLIQIFLNNPDLLLSPAGLLATLMEVLSKKWIYFILYFLIEIDLEIFFVGMKYGMIRDIILKGKTTLHSGFKYGFSHYLKIMSVTIIYYLMMFLPVIILLTIGFNLLIRSEIFGTIIMGVLFLVSLVYLFHITFRLLFVFPVMTFEHTTPLGTFKKDIHYVKTHIGHTFIAWIIFIVLGILLVVIKSPTKLLPEINLYLGIVLVIFLICVEFMVSTWEHIFMFKAYLSGKKKIKKSKK